MQAPGRSRTSCYGTTASWSASRTPSLRAPTNTTATGRAPGGGGARQPAAVLPMTCCIACTRQAGSSSPSQHPDVLEATHARLYGSVCMGHPHRIRCPRHLSAVLVQSPQVVSLLPVVLCLAPGLRQGSRRGSCTAPSACSCSTAEASCCCSSGQPPKSPSPVSGAAAKGEGVVPPVLWEG